MINRAIQSSMETGIREYSDIEGIVTQVVLSANDQGLNVVDVAVEAIKIVDDGIKQICGVTLSTEINSSVEQLVRHRK